MSNDKNQSTAGDNNPFRDYARSLLNETGGVASSIWLRDSQSGDFGSIAAAGTETGDLYQAPVVRDSLGSLFSGAFSSGQPRCTAVSGMNGATSARSVMVAPVVVEGQPLGAVSVIYGGELTPDEQFQQESLLALRANRFVSLLTSTGILQRRSPPMPTAPTPGAPQPLTPVSMNGSAAPAMATGSGKAAVPSAELLEFILSLQRSLDLSEVAGVAVNDGRLLFGADRVSLIMRRGSRGRRGIVKAVSGQDSVHPRGNMIKAMRALAEKVLESGEAIRFDGSKIELPVHVERLLTHFLEQGEARYMMMVPLLEPERLVKPEEPPGNPKPVHRRRRTQGVLVIEQIQGSEPPPGLAGHLDVVVDHISAAIYNAKTHSSIFLLPVWRSIGYFFEWLRGRRLAIATLITALLIGFGVALVVVPWEYRVDATGRLMPVIQREVFAPSDGQVVELFVQGGDRVEKDQQLLKLRSDELAAELVTVENTIQEKKKLLASLIAQRDAAEKSGNTEERVKVGGKAVETKVEIDGAEIQADILKNRIARLTVIAPISGVVTTFQVQQLLLNRPVKRGDVLVQVMDDTGEWHLELEVAENRLGRILTAQQKKRDAEFKANSSEEQAGAEPPPSETDARLGGSEPTKDERLDAGNRGEVPPEGDGLAEPENARQKQRPTAHGSGRKATFVELPIEYRLLTQPDASYQGRLKTLGSRAVTAETEGSVVEATGELSKEKQPTMSIGAEVRARIGCGMSNLGDVLFGDVVEFVQRYLWW